MITKNINIKVKVTAISIVAMILTGSIFYACKKDTMSQKECNAQHALYSNGNYSQPTQSIAIHTHINIGTAMYPVIGNATAGNYNGLVYGCSLTWAMPITGGDGGALATAVEVGITQNLEAVADKALAGIRSWFN